MRRISDSEVGLDHETGTPTADGLLPEVSDCAALAVFLHVDRKTVQGLAQRGEIPCRKVGKAYRFFRPAVLTWLCDRSAALPRKRR